MTFAFFMIAFPFSACLLGVTAHARAVEKEESCFNEGAGCESDPSNLLQAKVTVLESKIQSTPSKTYSERFMAYINGTAGWPEDVNPVIGVDEEGTAVFHPAFLEAGRQRTASVHLNYEPSDTRTKWWYNQLVVKESSDVSYFATNGHAYGYFGLQMVREKPFHGRVICSIWDQLCKGDDPTACPEEKQVKVLECGDDVQCVRFGGEGTGAKSMWDWNGWSKGKTYGFMTMFESVGDDRLQASCWLHADELGGNGWKLMSKMEVNRNGKPEFIRGYYSFLEQWTGAGFGAAREGQYGPSFTSPDEKAQTLNQVIHARYSHGSHGSEDTKNVAGYSRDGKWGLATGHKYPYVAPQRFPSLKLVEVPEHVTEFQKMVMDGALPKGKPPSVAANAPTFLAPPSGKGCYALTSRGTLFVSSAAENCEEFELDASGEKVQSRTTSQCLELQEGAVTLQHCGSSPNQLWSGTSDTHFCDSTNQWCLKHTSTIIKLGKVGKACVLARPNRLLSLSEPSSCSTFTYGSGKKAFTVKLATSTSQCVDKFPSGLGVYGCHGGSHQLMQRFGNKLCIGVPISKNCLQILNATPPMHTVATTSPMHTVATTTPMLTLVTTTSTPPPVQQPATQVSCGGHKASSCTDCPQGHGAGWCNGDCKWDHGMSDCVDKSAQTTTVSCGGHKASICTDCPQGHGAGWCNGDCKWDHGMSDCVDKSTQTTTVSCGGHKASICTDCPQGHGAGWCNGDCKWDYGRSDCVDKSAQTTTVSCGGHKASSCTDCPQGHGAAWCNGECKWDHGRSDCVDKSA